MPWVKKKVKITKKLSADKEFEEVYRKAVGDVANKMADPEEFRRGFTISTYARKLQKTLKGQIKEKKEFILKFDKNQDIYRQNDYKYNSAKFGKEMWDLKIDDSLAYIQRELKIVGHQRK